MVSKKYWAKLTTEFIDVIKNVQTTEKIELMGASFEVLPGVFSPVVSTDTRWFAEKVIPLVKNKNFLEIGAGTGVIACLAALNGASQVVATDINPQAIANIQLNARLHSLDMSVREGSVFDPIKKTELFDIIFWNHPFNFVEDSNEIDMISSSVFDPNYNYVTAFLHEGKKHLKTGGRLLLGTSNIARLQIIKKIALKEKYKVALLDKVVVPIYKEKKVQMDLRIYEFTSH